MATQTLKSDADQNEGPDPAVTLGLVVSGRRPQALYCSPRSFLCCVLEVVHVSAQGSPLEGSLICKINFEYLDLLQRIIEMGRSFLFCFVLFLPLWRCFWGNLQWMSVSLKRGAVTFLCRLCIGSKKLLPPDVQTLQIPCSRSPHTSSSSHEIPLPAVKGRIDRVPNWLLDPFQGISDIRYDIV